MIALWAGVAFVLGLALTRLGLPPLVGFLLAGFALGPQEGPWEPVLGELAHQGVLLLLFTVGLKVRLRNVVRAEVWGGALVHLGLVVALFAPALIGAGGQAPGSAVALALALGFSSTVVAAKVLEERRELRAFHGRVAIGILIVQDVVAVALLAVSGGHAPSPWALALLGLPWARPVLYRLVDWSGHGELLVLLGMVLAVGAGGWGFERLGLSPELGALLLGALLADHPRAQEVAQALWGLKEVFLVAFFLQVGMHGELTPEILALALALLAALPLKAAVFALTLPAFGLRARTAFLCAMSLASYSEFALIVAGLGVAAGWLEPRWLTVVGVTVAVSFALAAPANRASHALYARVRGLLERLERARRHPDDAPVSLGSADVAIVGMGRVGTGAYDFLRSRDVRVVGLDSDPAKVQRHLAEGRRVVYADGEDPGFWERLSLDGLRAIMLAVPDLEAKTIAASALRARGFTGLISATNVYPEETGEILGAGCTTTYNYFEEAGVGFAEHTWEALHPPPPAGTGAEGSTSPQ